VRGTFLRYKGKLSTVTVEAVEDSAKIADESEHWLPSNGFEGSQCSLSEAYGTRAGIPSVENGIERNGDTSCTDKSLRLSLTTWRSSGF
jgi:hypothetical protein